MNNQDGWTDEFPNDKGLYWFFGYLHKAPILGLEKQESKMYCAVSSRDSVATVMDADGFVGFAYRGAAFGLWKQMGEFPEQPDLTPLVESYFAERENHVLVDTRTDNPYQIAADLMDGAGYDPSDFESMSDSEIAGCVADFYKEQGVKLLDYDDCELDIGAYVELRLAVCGR